MRWRESIRSRGERATDLLPVVGASDSGDLTGRLWWDVQYNDCSVGLADPHRHTHSDANDDTDCHTDGDAFSDRNGDPHTISACAFSYG